ncbi:MAG: hypothetical protein HY225_01420 [Candidatus Vogelbacteria bacterium]|nr:hypothetical protein [Candidatus Vogelbacteria bacterium]
MNSKGRVNWTKIFKKAKDKLLKKARKQPRLKDGRDDPYWYDYNCDSLSDLKKTGRGNCVAWSDFTVELARRYSLKARSINIADRGDKSGKKDSHQISIIYDFDGTIWYQSCIRLRKLYKLKGVENPKKTHKLLCQMGAKDCDWKVGAVIVLTAIGVIKTKAANIRLPLFFIPKTRLRVCSKSSYENNPVYL